ncbi:MAG TPA: DPP IV N-terminal domain-containing protein, partial [Gemmatimonadales bacterium]|nr:DPP IV N-terminal domain-containing protein [Gemmatimonadales bacterium]
MRPSVFALLLVPSILVAQQPYAPASLSADDYARAEKFLGYNVNPLVYNGAVRGTWLAADRLWFRNQSAAGSEFLLVDPARKTLKQAFDQAAIATALSAAAETTYDALHLPFMDFTFGTDEKSISFDAGRSHWTCTLTSAKCTGERRQRDAAPRNDVLSPDGKRAAFIKSDNLWVRDVASGKETQLTTDGVPDFGYATDNAGWTKSDRPILVWSPDSKKIATFQQDQRGVGDMYLVQTRVGHPVLEAWKYPLPGDSVVALIQRVVVDVDQPKVIRLQMAPDQHRSTLCDHIACGQSWTDVSWSPDAARLFFVSTSRDHKHAWVRVADAATGAVREVFDESVPTQYESGFRGSNIRALWGTNEFIWFSERDNWGHLYLYDLGTGKLKNRITQGDWPVLDIVRTDEATRTVWFETAGHEPTNPYYRQLWSVRLDGSRLTNL